jgi:putative two-component system response regulator
MTDKTLLDMLRESEPQLPLQNGDQIRAILAPIIARLREPWRDEDASQIVDQVFAVCRLLYNAARSGEALALVRSLLSQPELAGHDKLLTRAWMMCGVLAADSGDISGAIEYDVRALRLATRANDRAQVANIWGNIGLATGISGHHDMAVRCYERSIAHVDAEMRPSYAYFTACGNLANSLCQMGNMVEGLRYGEAALKEMTPAFRERDLYGAILLQRNLVRLFIGVGRPQEAEACVREANAMAARTPSARARIAAATTHAAYELAIGNTDVALTRLDQALARAREVPAALQDTLACVIRAA